MSLSRPIRLLLLSGGSLVGRNIVHSLGARRKLVHLIASNSEASAPDNFLYDRVYIVPTTKEPEFENTFHKLLTREKPDLVIPCRDDDVVFLGQWKQQHPETPVLCGSPDLAELMNDQWLSFEWSQKQALPFVDSVQTQNIDSFVALQERYGFPLLLKPRAGFASRSIQLCWTAEGLKQLLKESEGFIVQPFIGDRVRLRAQFQQMQSGISPLFYSFEGKKYSLQALIGPSGQCLQTWTTCHHMENGHSLKVEPWESDELNRLIQRCAECFAQAGWRGPLNVQCQRDADGRYWIHEYNGRFTGATSARTLLGMDELGDVIRAFIAEDFPVFDPPQITEVPRLLSSAYADRRDIDVLKKNQVWSMKSLD